MSQIESPPSAISRGTDEIKKQKPPIEDIFNLPNQLTAGRFVLAIVLFALISLRQWEWCLAVFLLAAFTDWLDGHVARKLGITSTLGRNFDPLVDKMLTCGAFLFLIPIPESGIAPWMVCVVVTRELLVTSLRSYLENTGVTFGADWLGKLKMGLQCAALIAIFLYFTWRSVGWLEWTWGIRDALIYAMLAMTILSGLQYLWKAWLLWKSEQQQ